MKRVYFAAICVMLLACTAFGAALDGRSELLEKAEQGDPKAQFEVWRDYYRGYGGFRDIGEKKAKEFLSKSAEQGNVEAMYWLGVNSPTIDWLEKAAELGHADAQVELGVIYMTGEFKGVKADPKKALEYFQKAVDQEHPSAMTWLGEMYEKGLGTQTDYNKAVELYEKAAARPDGGSSAAIAKQNLARLRASHNIPAQKPAAPAKAYTPTTKTAPTVTKPAALAKAYTPTAKTAPAVTKPAAAPAKAVTPQNKPRMAVRAFVDRTGEGKNTAEAIMEMMVSELSKTNAFSLIEREQFEAYLGSEINLGQSGLIDPSTAPAVGKMKGLQYTVTGAITAFYYSEKASGVVIPILGIATQAKTAYVVLDIRILDNVTGEIVYASDQTGQAKRIAKGAGITDSRFFIGGYSKQIGGLLQEAARDAVKKHVSAIKNLGWRI